MTTQTDSETPTESGMIRYEPFGGGAMVELTVPKVRSYLVTASKAGRLPSKQNVVAYMKLAESQQLNPWAKDCYLIGYDTQDGTTTWNLIIAYQALLKRAEANAAYDGKESGIVIRWPQETDEVSHEIPGKILPAKAVLVGGWCKVKRKDRSVAEYQRVDFAVYNTGRGRWKLDPAGMIVKVACAAGVRESFPNHLGGLYIGEEMESGAAEVDVTSVVEIDEPETTQTSNQVRSLESKETPDAKPEAHDEEQGKEEQLQGAEVADVKTEAEPETPPARQDPGKQAEATGEPTEPEEPDGDVLDLLTEITDYMREHVKGATSAKMFLARFSTQKSDLASLPVDALDIIAQACRYKIKNGLKWNEDGEGRPGE